MDIFKTFTLLWWQGMLFKWGMVAFGLLVASYWPGSARYRTLWWILFLLPTAYVAYIWWIQ